MYVPGPIEADIDSGGTLTSGVTNALQTAFDDLMTALGTGGIVPVILHAGAAAPTTITEFDVDSLVATQRNRLRR
jgi:hypothetical protein